MTKYIDAEKLKAEIERQILDARSHGWHISEKYCEEILNFAHSLQQGQPEFPTTDEEVEAALASIPKVKLPKKYETPDWLWVYGNIGLTGEHIKRLNNAINILESLNEHTDAKYLREIKDKLMEVNS